MKLGKYRHYKGKDYEVLDVVLDTETREKMVLYKALYPVNDLDKELGEEPKFVRPKSMFLEEVVVEGQKVPRFRYIEED